MFARLPRPERVLATFSWSGGYGLYGAVRLWTPLGGAVPGAGDTAALQTGEVVAQDLQVGATVRLGSPNGAAAPVLDLRGSSVAGLTMPNGLPPQPFATVASPTKYGTVNVRGQSRIGSIAIGNSADIVRAPSPYGHGALKAPDNLTVNLEPQAVLGAGFDVKDGSTLTVTGDTTTGFNAGASTIEGGHVVIGAPLAGPGTITMTNGAVISPTGEADAGTLELARRVGAGVTIDIRMGSLLLDKPMLFAGTLGIRASEGSGSYGPQDVLLKGLAASSFGFDDAAHRLTLFSGSAVLDTVQFTPDTVSASFKTGPYASLDVLQTADGVLLRGLYSYSPAGAVEIPRH
jgi:hypothetical protein